MSAALRFGLATMCLIGTAFDCARILPPLACRRLDQRIGRRGAGIGEPVLDEEGHGVLVARVGDVDLRRLDLRIAQRGAHHPRGDRILVGRAELAALSSASEVSGEPAATRKLAVYFW